MRTRAADRRPQTVAITGGARGIGRATAAAFAAQGAQVVIGDLDAELSASAATSIGPEVHGRQLDVTSPESFVAFWEQATALVGPIDALVNNAGIMVTERFVDEDEALTERMLGVNLRGTLIGSRLAARDFLERGHGHLVNIASLAGISGYAGVATYCATKHAVVGLTDALHRELAPAGIGVTSVMPGVVRTDLSAGARVPRWIEGLTTVDPEHVAAAIVRVIGSRRTRVSVPRPLGAMVRTSSFLPAALNARLEQLTGLDQVFLEPKETARLAYMKRVNQEMS